MRIQAHSMTKNNEDSEFADFQMSAIIAITPMSNPLSKNRSLKYKTVSLLLAQS